MWLLHQTKKTKRKESVQFIPSLKALGFLAHIIMKTFKEILDTNGGEPIELKVTVPGKGDKIIFD